MKAMISSEKLETLGGKNNKTKPTVYYKNLYRFKNCFIAGSVATKKDGISDCVPDAIITLFKDDKAINKINSDAFGDFKFDDLPKNSGTYRLEIESKQYGKKTLSVDLVESESIGTVWI